MDEELEISLLTANATVGIVKLAGTINMDTSEDAYQFVTKLLDEHLCQNLIFEVNDVSYVSSAGIGTFMSLYERMTESGKAKIILVGVSDSFRRVMDLVGCLDYFVLTDSLKKAQELMLQEE